MAKRHYYLIVDTETTQPMSADGVPIFDDDKVTPAKPAKVADFGAVVCDKRGKVYASCGVLTRGIYDNPEEYPLFFTGDADPLWGKATLQKRYDRYESMLSDGSRMLASVGAINRWLARVNGKYSPVITAYNFNFDRDKMDNTGIDWRMFDRSFCLWYSAVERFAFTREYKEFVFYNGFLNNRTKLGNWSYQTKAEVMAMFLEGTHLPPEPHTALEDARDYEVPILKHVLKGRKREDAINPPTFSWRQVQVFDHFIARAGKKKKDTGTKDMF